MTRLYLAVLTAIARACLFTFDVVNGLYSGIPACCVLYFSALHVRADGGLARVNETREQIIEVGYVQCPNCYETRRAARPRSNGHVATWLVNAAERISTHSYAVIQATEKP